MQSSRLTVKVARVTRHENLLRARENSNILHGLKLINVVIFSFFSFFFLTNKIYLFTWKETLSEWLFFLIRVFKTKKG